jgi:xanthine dehydrogenase iron-sulfur cluster and FAD-binding subunit A
MFFRLAEQYRAVVLDLVLSLQALARSLQDRGLAATCYTCGDGRNGQGASFVANLGENHMVRFLVSDFGISWVESRDGHELVKLEGAEAIQELQRVAEMLQEAATTEPVSAKPTSKSATRSASKR